MSEQAPELHAKTLLTSIAAIGTAVNAIDEAAAKLASAPPTPAPPAIKNGAGVPSR